MLRPYLNRRKLLQSSFVGLLTVPISAGLGRWRHESRGQAIAKTGAIVTPTATKQISEVPLPAIFAVEITGETDAGSFGPLPARLELTAPQGDDPNSLMVLLYMDAQRDDELGLGSIFWQSFLPESAQRDEYFSRVTVNGNRVQMQINPSDAIFRGDVTWFTQLTGSLAEALGGNLRSGVVPTEGTMAFTLDGSQISGEMSLSGVSDMGVTSTYQAQFSGQQQD